MAAECPALVAVVVVDIEDGEVVGVQAVTGRNVPAGLGNPACAPIVFGGMGWVQAVAEVGFKFAAVDAGTHGRLARAGCNSQRGERENRSIQHDCDDFVC